MRILSVVTLISPHGEYGGPVRVALNQARELIALGHDVVLAGAVRGFDGPPPRDLEGVPVSLYPARTLVPGAGFAGLAAPGLYRALPRLTRDIDVMHVHLARDLVTLPAADWARRHGVPYVVQTHGMIDESNNPLARPLDAAVTRRVLRGARRVFYLTERERRDLTAVAGATLAFQELANGVPLPFAPDVARDSSPEVLYLARLARRKRPLEFVRMAQIVAAEFPATTFRLVGPDEGEADAVERLAFEGHADVLWEGPIAPEAVIARMARSSIYVLPAVDEPYPMSVLEAMSLGLPVVITESCGLASLVREAGSGIVVDGSTESLAHAVIRLLRDPDEAAQMGAAGVTLTRERLAMSAVAETLQKAYAG
jgi:Glycosyltransferase